MTPAQQIRQYLKLPFVSRKKHEALMREQTYQINQLVRDNQMVGRLFMNAHTTVNRLQEEAKVRAANGQYARIIPIKRLDEVQG